VQRARRKQQPQDAIDHPGGERDGDGQQRGDHLVVHRRDPDQDPVDQPVSGLRMPEHGQRQVAPGQLRALGDLEVLEVVLEPATDPDEGEQREGLQPGQSQREPVQQPPLTATLLRRRTLGPTVRRARHLASMHCPGKPASAG